MQELTSEQVFVLSEHRGQTKHILLEVIEVHGCLIHRVDKANVHVKGMWRLSIVILIQLQVDINEIHWDGISTMLEAHHLSGLDAHEIVQFAKHVGNGARCAQQELLELCVFL